MTIDNQMETVIADLRRAAIAGAAGQAADRAAGVLVDGGAQTGVDRFVPSTAPLAVAIDGPGLFMLRDARQTVFSRLGDFRFDEAGRLIDGRGDAVLGFKPGDSQRSPSPLCIDAADFASKRFASFRIDESGVLSGVEQRVEKHTRRRGEVVVPIGRLAIALFAAPERLARFGDTGFVATRAAGSPTIASPSVSGAGTLRTHVVAAGAIDLEADLRKLWRLSRKGELEAALSSAADGCVRTALGLVR